MRRYLINSKVLIHVMKVLSPRSSIIFQSSDRCLKLGALRCLRSIISLKDEFYNRHIIQHDLFRPVFEAFRSNPVGDNLVSSSIIGKNDVYVKNSTLSIFLTFFVHRRRNMRLYKDRKHQISNRGYCYKIHASEF
jgi:hypothetical protein